MMLDIPFIAAAYNTLLEGTTKNCYRTKSKRFLDPAAFGGSARNDRRGHAPSLEMTEGC